MCIRFLSGIITMDRDSKVQTITTSVSDIKIGSRNSFDIVLEMITIPLSVLMLRVFGVYFCSSKRN